MLCDYGKMICLLQLSENILLKFSLCNTEGNERYKNKLTQDDANCNNKGGGGGVQYERKPYLELIK